MKINIFIIFITALIFNICSTVFSKPLEAIPQEEHSANLCPDPTFSDAARWDSHNGYKVISGEGINGNSALFLERTNHKLYAVLSKELKGLKPNTRYEFGVLVKGENVELKRKKGYDKRGATICIEFRHKGKYVRGGSYPYGVYGSKDWTLIKGKVTTPEKFDKATICFYLGRHTTGKAWFYSPYVRRIAPAWKVGLLCPVMNYAINPGKQKFIFSSFVYGLKGYKDKKFIVKIDVMRNTKVEQKIISTIKNNRITTSINLLPGKYLLRLSLINKENNKISLCKEVPVQVIDPISMRPKNSVFIDNRGRCWVNGEKFLPVGLFTNQKSSGFKKWGHKWRAVDSLNLKNSPFNCIMPYDGMSWKLNGTKLSGIAAHREVLDELNSNGIKVIFSVKDIRNKWNKWYGAKGIKAVTKKVVETFRNHPALLAWYTNDEKGVEQLDLEKRKLIGELDPFHPTWQVQCHHYNFKKHQGATDIFGVDPYSLKKNIKDMTLVLKTMNLAREAVGFSGKIALWVAPQIFPWSYYKDSEELHWPTETQIRSTSLLMAIMGAKGFIMFSYSDLIKNEEVGFKKHWPAVCNVAQTLKDISPFILGDPIAPPVEVKVIKGNVKAKAFTADNGQTCVLITAIGPGQAEANIKIKGVHKLKSRYGCSILSQDGTWTFKGKDIDSDILFPAK